uniref:Uncharacterized protein n=2 Tax=Cacopsylla melanoneura TaxID=428564 RepID=A0A8D8ZLV5_9HEMI
MDLCTETLFSGKEGCPMALCTGTGLFSRLNGCFTLIMVLPLSCLMTNDLERAGGGLPRASGTLAFHGLTSTESWSLGIMGALELVVVELLVVVSNCIELGPTGGPIGDVTGGDLISTLCGDSKLSILFRAASNSLENSASLFRCCRSGRTGASCSVTDRFLANVFSNSMTREAYWGCSLVARRGDTLRGGDVLLVTLLEDRAESRRLR